jgi:hypothetical protein
MTIALHVCAVCGRVNYPAREVCRNCLGDRLEFTETSGGGRLLAQSTLHVSGDPFFRERLPWRIGSVLLDNGAVVIAHLGPAPDPVIPSQISVIPAHGHRQRRSRGQAPAGTHPSAGAGGAVGSRLRGNDGFEGQAVELRTEILNGEPAFFAHPVNQEA